MSRVPYDAAVMEKLFNPASVVIVGASRKTGPGTFNIVENLLHYGYPGRVYAINPKAQDILGVPSYPRAGDLPEVPELAIVTVPRELVPPVIADCCAHGIRLFIIVPQGLAEADAAGAVIQAEYTRILREHGARALGPNTLGTVNAFDGFSSSFMPLDRREEIGVGVICQTGLFVATDVGPTMGLGKGIDVANQGDLGFDDALRHYAEDPRIKVVVIHMEGLRPGEGRSFLDVLRHTLPRKPVLIYKTGRSAAGAEAAGSHTGSMAGSHAVYEAAFAEAGAILLRDVDDMDDSAKALLHLAPMRGRRVAVITVSGGGGIMAADACEEHGLELAEFTPATMDALRGIYPSWMQPGNPLDVWPAAIGKFYPEVFIRCFELVTNDPNVDGIVCIGGSFGVGSFDISDFMQLSAERRDKPIVWWLHGRKGPGVAQKVEATRKLAVYSTADRAVRALARVAHYHVDVKDRVWEEPVAPVGIDRAAAARLLGAAAGRPQLGAEAFDLLTAYGVPVATWATADSPEAAAEAAAGVTGFPAVLKAVGPHILHKTELGAVRLNLISPEAVLDAARDLTARLGGAGDLSFLVQRFVPGGHEVILGAKSDPHFGPLVLFGLGGVFAEILQDVAIGLAPLTPAKAEALIRRTRAAGILSGARGQGPADIAALADALVRLSWLVADHPEVVELDLNPVKVFAAGRGCLAVDARVLLGR